MGPNTDCIKTCARCLCRWVGSLWLAMSVGAMSAAGQGRVDSIPVDEIERGQRGYGLSVFTGSEVERFEVEVLGLMRNASPDVSYIMARLSGLDLEETGVIGGMSGSPVYIEDRLAGAVAFSWTFSTGAVAGITPIGSMRELSTLPTAAAAPPPSDAGVALDRLLDEERSEADLELALRVLVPRLGAGATSGIQFNTVGFGDRTRDLLSRVLGPVAPAGRSDDTAPIALDAGSSVAGVLIDGDLHMAVSGTVTERSGDEILALGHSFLGLGPVRLPMAPAEVITVISSRASSFKLTNIGPVVGAFDQDRLAGMRGRLGLEARTIPVHLAVRGLQHRDYHVRLADVPSLSPTLAAISVLQALDAASYSGGRQGIDMAMHFDLGNHGDLALRQSFDGDNASFGAAVYFLTVAAYLMQNSLAEVEVNGIDLDLVQVAQPRSASLVGVHAERTQVRPGEEVTLNLDFVEYRGEPFRHSTTIEIPSDLPAGRYFLFVGDGPSVDAARLLMAPTEPVNFRQALDLLRSFHSREQLVVLGVFGGPGLVVAGQVMPRLPGSVRSIWDAASTMSATRLGLAIAQQETEALDQPMDGLVRVDLEVLRRKPVSESSPVGVRHTVEGESTGGDGGAAPGGPSKVGSEKGSGREDAQ